MFILGLYTWEQISITSPISQPCYRMCCLLSFSFLCCLQCVVSGNVVDHYWYIFGDGNVSTTSVQVFDFGTILFSHV